MGRAEAVHRELKHIKTMRQMWSRIPTKAGKPSKGPDWMAVTECTVCHVVKYEDSKRRTAAKRFLCREPGCLGAMKPFIADGQPLDAVLKQFMEWRERYFIAQEDTGPEEVTDRWLRMAMNGHARAVAAFGCPVEKTGADCSWCHR